MHTSDQIADLAAALSKAQGEIEGVVADASNPAFKRGNKEAKYATLAAVWDAIRAPLTKHGLSVVQITDMDAQGGVVLVSRLMHASGQFIDALYPVRPVQTTPQGYGSALSYARRYALMALVGIAPEDDDGNAASQGAPQQQARPRQQRQQPEDAGTPFDEGDGEPDPRDLAKTIVRAIDQQTSLPALNVLMRGYGEQTDSADVKPGSALSKLPPEGRAWVMDRANKRRGVLAQAPAEAAE